MADCKTHASLLSPKRLQERWEKLVFDSHLPAAAVAAAVSFGRCWCLWSGCHVRLTLRPFVTL